MKAIMELYKRRDYLNEKYKNKKIKKYIMERIYYFKFLKELSIKNKKALEYQELYELCELLYANKKEFRYLDSFGNYSFATGKVVNEYLSGDIKIINNFYKATIKLYYKNNELEISVYFKYNKKSYNIQLNNSLSKNNTTSSFNKFCLGIVNTLCVDCYNSLLRKLWKDNILIKNIKEE